MGEILLFLSALSIFQGEIVAYFFMGVITTAHFNSASSETVLLVKDNRTVHKTDGGITICSSDVM